MSNRLSDSSHKAIRQNFLTLIVATFLYFPPAGLLAQEDILETEQELDERPEETWDIRIGALGGYGPKFDGSDHYGFFIAPKARISWREIIVVKETQARAQAHIGDLYFGPIIGFEKGRSDDDDKDIQGVGSVDGGIGVGAFIKYKPDGYSLKFEIRKEVAGGHGGFVGEFRAAAKLPSAENPWGRLVGKLIIGDDDYMEAYYGINGIQSANSGLATYDADFGLRSASIAWETAYGLTEHLAIGAALQYLRMLPEAADSPIVDDAGSPNNVTFAVGLNYIF